jgi:hypothetical protein
MIRAFAALLLALCLASCATVPSRSPEVEAKLLQANESLDRLNEEIAELHERVQMVRLDIQELYRHPGWPEMQEIIEFMQTAAGEGNIPGGGVEIEQVGAAWSEKYGEPWEMMFARYLMLVKSCSELEAKRLSLQSRLLSVQGQFLGASVMAYSSGRHSQGQSIDAVVHILARSGEELEAYTVNSLGLY